MEQTSLTRAMVAAKCPKCRIGDMFPVPVYSFRKLTQVHFTCPHCEANLNPEPDFYYGAMYISYALSVALFITVMVVLNTFFNDPDIMVYIVAVVVLNILFLPFMLRYSKVIYLYMVGNVK
ncbi:DUF983 domain-containing protein [Negadavirga shengliensis]|uniref:DUF983 domain-containing protein n=1 Tax=Negadavirga shengliensis TaxID=1389218 RepID=A0ABV9T361_9BACT